MPLMIKKLTLWILPLFSFLFLSACSNGIKGVAETPEITVSGVKLGQFSLAGGDATLALKVRNPNSFSIPLRGLDYGLKLNGAEVAKGRTEGKLTLAGGETRIIQVPVQLDMMKLIRVAPGVLLDRRLNYDLSGHAHFPFINLPFQRTGDVGAYSN
jgi:LEA14-like dessication related protein